MALSRVPCATWRPNRLGGREVDARSELFSFGAVLYEMLTGKRAFDGNSATAVRLAILEREPRCGLLTSAAGATGGRRDCTPVSR